jgi:hypothetical protein
MFGNCQRPEIGFQCVSTSSRILMQVAEQNCEIERIALIGGRRQAACRKRHCLILAEEARLRRGGYEIGAGRFAITGAVEVFGPQHWIVDKDRGSGTVKFSSPRVGERSVDTFTHQRMREYEPIVRWPHENVSHQRIAGILRFLQQHPEMSQTE